MEIIIAGLAIFFALNMGASTFASSMGAAVGSGTLTKRQAQLLYLLLIVIGAYFFGSEVAKTLSKGLMPEKFLDVRGVIVILASASLSMFVANMMHIPQSTSLSTVAAVCGVGAHYQAVSMEKVWVLIAWWVVSVIIGFLLIYGAVRFIYPPRRRNFWLYEKIANNKERLAWFIILTSCYKAFALGANNVANVVGPVAATGLISMKSGLLWLGAIFALGSFVFLGPMKTTSERIVPLGILTAAIINFFTGTITFLASLWGIPQPAVIIYTVAVLAVGSIKDSPSMTLEKPLTKKMFFTWCINPVLTFGVSYAFGFFLLK